MRNRKELDTVINFVKKLENHFANSPILFSKYLEENNKVLLENKKNLYAFLQHGFSMDDTLEESKSMARDIYERAITCSARIDQALLSIYAKLQSGITNREAEPPLIETTETETAETGKPKPQPLDLTKAEFGNVLTCIFSFLTFQDLINVVHSCKTWRRLALNIAINEKYIVLPATDKVYGKYILNCTYFRRPPVTNVTLNGLFNNFTQIRLPEVVRTSEEIIRSYLSKKSFVKTWEWGVFLLWFLPALFFQIYSSLLDAHTTNMHAAYDKALADKTPPGYDGTTYNNFTVWDVERSDFLRQIIDNESSANHTGDIAICLFFMSFLAIVGIAVSRFFRGEEDIIDNAIRNCKAKYTFKSYLEFRLNKLDQDLSALLIKPSLPHSPAEVVIPISDSFSLMEKKMK
ncbi:MAG TPA: F-box protein [Gammaproteobacteria bacterium]|jgi:hypothetical protein|nr:F-box protein [Gammaproteobacteria bacterium]